MFLLPTYACISVKAQKNVLKATKHTVSFPLGMEITLRDNSGGFALFPNIPQFLLFAFTAKKYCLHLLCINIVLYY